MDTTQKLANAVKTYYNVGGHTKAARNIEMIQSYLNSINGKEVTPYTGGTLSGWFHVLEERGYRVLSINYLLNRGVINGEGSY